MLIGKLAFLITIAHKHNFAIFVGLVLTINHMSILKSVFISFFFCTSLLIAQEEINTSLNHVIDDQFDVRLLKIERVANHGLNTKSEDRKIYVQYKNDLKAIKLTLSIENPNNKKKFSNLHKLRLVDENQNTHKTNHCGKENSITIGCKKFKLKMKELKKHEVIVYFTPIPDDLKIEQIKYKDQILIRF